MSIVAIRLSKKAHKRYEVEMNNGKTFDFGLKDGFTYIDHHDKLKRKNYWLRHASNPIEKKLIMNLVPSPALFSAYLLWGDSTDIIQNINFLNNLWHTKKSK